MAFTRKHLTEDELRQNYERVLARLEEILLREHLSVLVQPDYVMDAAAAGAHANALAGIERLEADLKQQLGE